VEGRDYIVMKDILSTLAVMFIGIAFIFVCVQKYALAQCDFLLSIALLLLCLVIETKEKR
jgi:hypothetical protein